MNNSTFRAPTKRAACLKVVALLGLWMGVVQQSSAAPFDICPSRAFLTQNTVATAYSVNLVTGDYALLEDNMGTSGKINATGFSVHDRYLYTWSYEAKRLARINSDFQVEPLDMQNTTGTSFYVGDVAVTENVYYAYRPGASNGLFAVSLDPAAADYLEMRRIVNGSDLNLRIFDLAFHPDNGNAYSVDRNGVLWLIDVAQGSASNLGNLGFTGTFGAIYFDVEGNLYFSRNNDGAVFKVDIANVGAGAELFAIGPASGTNDGARCALAPVVDESDVSTDYGDAPESYGTRLTDNGARHGIPDDPSLFLGKLLDGESDGTPFPLSDDTIDDIDDEDGVQWATGVEPGQTAMVLVEASAPGTLSAWIDFNQNGTFDSNEQIVTDRQLTRGSNLIAIQAPVTAVSGETWARFRLSSSTGMQPTGGVADGEVEDLTVVITSGPSTVNWYPSKDGWTTIAFEDNWPIEGDYDMNDLVVFMRTGVFRTSDQVNLVSIRGEIAAVGAAYENGFAIRLPGINRADVDASNIDFRINNQPVERLVLEEGREEAILVVSYNVFNYVSAGEDCLFYRTQPGCGGNIELTFSIQIPMSIPRTADLSGAFDPFLFATPGAWHGELFSEPPGRGYEIHLKNQAPTEAFDVSLFGGQDDASDPALNFYYQTASGMPWALEVARRWDYPREYIDLLLAYPKFGSFVLSGGIDDIDWFSPANADSNFIFTK